MRRSEWADFVVMALVLAVFAPMLASLFLCEPESPAEVIFWWTADATPDKPGLPHTESTTGRPAR